MIDTQYRPWWRTIDDIDESKIKLIDPETCKGTLYRTEYDSTSHHHFVGLTVRDNLHNPYEQPTSSCVLQCEHSHCLACRKTQMKFNEPVKVIFFSTPAALIWVVLSVQFWDLPLATWIAKYLLAYFPHVKNSDIPDLLLITVVTLTSLSWIFYFYLVHRNIHDRRTLFFRVVGTTMPLTFVVKDVLKWIFGRTNTRIWLSHPSLYDFHWFAGTKEFEGFPSGHMLVFTPVFMALWQFFPRYRLYYGVVWFCLAIALIVTEYHFLSDVLAGAFIGAVVYLTVSRAAL